MIDNNLQKKLLKATLKTGDVFLKKFEEAAHQKLFIIAGVSTKKVFLCSVFINSEIHPSIKSKPNIVALQVPLLKSRNSFLSHDSFANCTYPIPHEVEKLIDEISKGDCKTIGSIHNQDLIFIRKALVNSGLLTEEEIELYALEQ